jgi:hypothetical protein
MASDFYSIIRGSVESRGLKTSTERRGLYEQARRAMIDKLWANDPPLGADEISRRISFFDAAVERIEGDYEPDPEPEAPAPAVLVASPAPPAAKAGISGAKKRPTPPPPPEEAVMPPPLPEPRRGRRKDPPAEEEYDGLGGSDEPIPSIFRREPTSDPPLLPSEAEPAPAGLGHLDEGFDAIRRRLPRIAWRPQLPTGERARVRLLAVVVACLAVVLVGFLVFAFYPRETQATVSSGAMTTQRVGDPATALDIPKRPVAVTQSFNLFDGGDPTVFVGSPSNPVRFDHDKEGAFSRIASSVDNPGARAIIGPGLAQSLAGRDIRVTLSLRSSHELGAAKLRFAYQSGLAVSHWQEADAPADYGDVGLIWRVPSQRTDAKGDYLLIEPGIPGDGTSVDIRSIRIDVIGRS